MDAELLQQLAWAAAAVTALVTAIRFLLEFRASRLQRENELRWKQAQTGKSLNDEMQEDKEAWSAMQMLDSGTRDYEVAGETITIEPSDIPIALNPETYRDEPKDRFIRDAFDYFFYYMATMDHYISRKLILAEDVAYPMEYYLPHLKRYAPEVNAYLAKYRLHRVKAFLDNHPAWKAAPSDPIT